MQPTDFTSHAQQPARGRGALSSRRAWLAGTSLPLVAAIAGVLLLAAWPRQDTPTSIDLTALASAPAVETASTMVDEDFPENVEYTVQRNDTLDQIFRSVGVDLAELAELRQRPEIRRALDIVRPGDIITFTHVDGALQSLNRQISNTLTLSVVVVALVTSYRGAMSVDPDQVNLMRTLGAKKHAIFLKLVVPASLTDIFAGLKLTVGFALIGAIIGEFMSSSAGLGHAIFKAGSLYIISKVFAVLLVTIALALVLSWLVGKLERLLTPWRREA